MEKVSSPGYSSPPLHQTHKGSFHGFFLAGGRGCGWLWGPLPALGCEISNLGLELSPPPLAPKEA